MHVAVGLGAGLAAALVAGCDIGSRSESEPAPPSQHFRSRPDLEPPVVSLDTVRPSASPGYIFLAPKTKTHASQTGPMILDNAGRVVWFNPLDTPAVTDFRVQQYGGRPVLTWWRGRATDGVGDGYYVIADPSYAQIATISAGNGLTGDVHEFLITPRQTALFSVYQRQSRDLSAVGGPRHGAIFEGVVQEVDIASGKVLFEWHSSDHVSLTESYAKPPPAARGAKAAPYDYFHLNSIDVEPNGNLLLSARNTHALYEIERSDGSVRWRLGGKKSDFRMGPGTTFAWQHDARRQPDGSISVFDNGADPKVEEFSRVLDLEVDEARARATLVRSWAHPNHLSAGSQGNAQFLADGHLFVGWGARPYFTEYDGQGAVVLDGTFGIGTDMDSYRAYRFPWTGRPGSRPAVAVDPGANGRVVVYASWNGSTEVGRWQVLAGPDGNHVRPVASAPKSGFETPIEVTTNEPYVVVRALDGRSTVLGTSPPTPVAGVGE